MAATDHSGSVVTAPRPPAPHATVAGDTSEDDQPGQVSVYLLPSAIKAARRWRARTGQTNARLAFEAIAANRERLRQLVVGYGVDDTMTAAVDALFPASPRTRRSRPSSPSGTRKRRVLWTMKATDAQVQVLDDFVAETGAVSRSELVSAAVEAYLLT